MQPFCFYSAPRRSARLLGWSAVAALGMRPKVFGVSGMIVPDRTSSWARRAVDRRRAEGPMHLRRGE